MVRNKTFSGQKFKSLLITSSVAWVIAIILQLSDSIIAGQFIGSDAVAAISIITPLYSFASFLGMLISVGGSIVYVNLMGKFKEKTASKFFSESIIAAVGIGTIYFLFTFFGGNLFLSFFDLTDEVHQMAQQYLFWYNFVFLLTPLYSTLEEFVYSDGDETICNIASVFQVFGNIGLSILFVLPLGIAGIGLGTFISFSSGIIILCSHFFRKKNSLKFVWFFHIGDFPQIIKYSYNSSCVFIFHSIISIVLNKFVIILFGEAYLQMLTAVAFITELEMAFDALGNALAPLMNVYLAEKNPQRCKKIMKTASKTAVLYGIAFTLIFILIANLIPTFFNINDPEVYNMSVISIRIMAFECPLVSLICLYSSYYMLKGIINVGVITMFLKTFGFTSIFCLGISVFVGPIGIGIGYLLSALCSILFMFIFIRIRYMKEDFPLLLEKSNKHIYNFDLCLDDTSIVKTNKEISISLEQDNASMKATNMCTLLIEEICMSVVEHNNTKDILMEISVYVDDKTIEIILWDTGEVFNITDSDNLPTDFRAFFVSSLMEQQKVKSHQTLVGFNRNAFKLDKN